MPIKLVSVIIPVYNGLPDLDVQLAAVEAQDYTGEFEVIISDNGSTDGVREHLNDHSFALNLRCIDSSDVRGTAHARNAGIAAARGDFLAFTDQDDAVYPNWLTELTRAAAQSDAVGGAIELETLNSRDVSVWRTVPEPQDRFDTQFLPFAMGNNFGMWRRVLDIIGGFDEQFLGGGEDLDISWRIQQAGLSLGHSPDALVAYRLRSSVSATFRQGQGYGRAWCQAARKHVPQGAKLPTVRDLALIAYIHLVRNPWLPKRFSPLPIGEWAVGAGSLYGCAQMRARYAFRDLAQTLKRNSTTSPSDMM